MRTALDFPLDVLDGDERSFVGRVREHGWFRTSVLGDSEGRGFSYTTGFWSSANHPELIIFSTKHEIAHEIFWNMFREARDGVQLPFGKRTDAVFANLPAYVFPVAQRHYASFLGWSRWFFDGNEFPCLQIVWSDRAGVFPWESGFAAEFEGNQEDLFERGWVNELAD